MTLLIVKRFIFAILLTLIFIIMYQKFFDIIKPLTDYIDSGKFFRQPLQWLYYVIGCLCALFPFYVIYELIDKYVFKYADGKETFALILVLLILIAVCFGSFLLWFNRAQKLPELLKPDSKFVAVPAVANFIQTSGEFYGLFLGVFGFLSSLILTLFDFYVPIPFMTEVGFGATVMFPIVGYVIVVGCRYIAELVLSIADIANNTDKIANK